MYECVVAVYKSKSNKKAIRCILLLCAMLCLGSLHQTNQGIQINYGSAMAVVWQWLSPEVQISVN